MITRQEPEKIAMQFQLAGTPGTIEPYGSGHINDTYHLITSDSQGEHQYILQRMNSSIFTNTEELIENVAKVTAFLQEKIRVQGGDPQRETLSLIPTREGHTYYKDENGDGWRVYPFIPNVISYDKANTPELFAASGYAFGHFQQQLADFPAKELHETIPDFHNTQDRFAKFKKAVGEDIAGRAASVQKEIQFILDREADCSYFAEQFAAGCIPLRVTHNDTKLNNVLFDADTKRAICVIDLDTVMPGFAAHDFGDAIRFGASTAAEDEKDLSKVSCDLEYFRAYFEGFQRGCEGSLTEAEIAGLPMGAKLMTYECGMRFLTDYLQRDTYFKISYPEQNLDRARTQLKLVQDMEEKWEEITKIVR